MTKENILVTGGAGYVGSHACKALCKAGYQPISYDSLVTGHEWAVKWGPLEIGDILDSGRLNEVIQKYKPVAAMHFAAFAYVGESVVDPAKYYKNNVLGTFSLLEALRAHNVTRFIFSSTCATYGIPSHVPIDEQQEQAPINPYGRTKLVVEHMLRDFCAAYGMGAVALRYFNAAGADLETEIGEAHEPESHLIPLVLEAALDPSRKIQIFGINYNTSDGTCIRDYIHVADLANAHVRALDFILSDKNVGFSGINLGTGTGYSVREVIEMAGKVTGSKILVEIGPKRPGDPDMLIADASLANRVLGWVPEQSDLETIIRTAWDWMKSYKAQN